MQSLRKKFRTRKWSNVSRAVRKHAAATGGGGGSSALEERESDRLGKPQLARPRERDCQLSGREKTTRLARTKPARDGRQLQDCPSNMLSQEQRARPQTTQARKQNPKQAGPGYSPKNTCNNDTTTGRNRRTAHLWNECRQPGKRVIVWVDVMSSMQMQHCSTGPLPLPIWCGSIASSALDKPAPGRIPPVFPAAKREGFTGERRQHR